ncbi:class I SAM-dependent methyltransferase [Diaphorobacter aerolatus]|uniref:Class I SAM-dependent methyltransferase n=1 Tax=Diaphorobacter aerolatus TaxID=1288495 RepID=A0A7H0GNK4_9BURK|nr:class I SAM-dependent methyltransferase [Diaphorobacter aerolatus]QNP49870.1 class I SAM-dependent methyltransferase [Diaphorobacter aerolatus]
MEFDKYADSYSEDLKNSIPAGLRTIEYFSTYKVKLARQLAGNKPKCILDFGCGVGQCSQYLVRDFAGSQIFGFDVSEESLAIARERLPQASFSAEWNEIANRKYDLIFTSNVFHHIDPQDHILWLGRLKDQLNPDGCLVIFEHNPVNPLTRMVFRRCIFDQDAVMIGQANFLKLAKAAGFNKRASKYTLFFPGPLKVLAPLERFIGWLPLGAQYYLALKSD